MKLIFNQQTSQKLFLIFAYICMLIVNILKVSIFGIVVDILILALWIYIYHLHVSTNVQMKRKPLTMEKGIVAFILFGMVPLIYNSDISVVSPVILFMFFYQLWEVTKINRLITRVRLWVRK